MTKATTTTHSIHPKATVLIVIYQETKRQNEKKQNKMKKNQQLFKKSDKLNSVIKSESFMTLLLRDISCVIYHIYLYRSMHKTCARLTCENENTTSIRLQSCFSKLAESQIFDIIQQVQKKRKCYMKDLFRNHCISNSGVKDILYQRRIYDPNSAKLTRWKIRKTSVFLI